MNSDLANMIERVEAEQRWLSARLGQGPALLPEALARVRAAALAESVRMGRRGVWMRSLRVWVAAAAGVVLAVGLTRSAVWRGSTSADQRSLILNEWAAALDDSGQRVSWVMDDSPMQYDEPYSTTPESQMRDLIDSLDETLRLGV